MIWNCFWKSFGGEETLAMKKKIQVLVETKPGHESESEKKVKVLVQKPVNESENSVKVFVQKPGHKNESETWP